MSLSTLDDQGRNDEINQMGGLRRKGGGTQRYISEGLSLMRIAANRTKTLECYSSIFSAEVDLVAIDF